MLSNNDNSSNFICSVCGHEFQNENQFYGHLQIHSGEVVWKCLQCKDPNISFKSQSKLIAHENLHHNLVRPFKCLKCELVFGRVSQLNYHKRNVHLGEKSQICQICGKGFFRKTDLKTHLNIHLGTNQLICEICGQKFNHVSNLIRHCRSHAGIKPYPCSFCGKRFTQLSSLTRHKKIHETVSGNTSTEKEVKIVSRRQHYCKTCGESFQFIFLLRQHELHHMENVSTSVCKNCNQIFQSQPELQAHNCKAECVNDNSYTKLMTNENSMNNIENNKISALTHQGNLQVELYTTRASPVLRDYGKKLNVIEIETDHDESITISDILSAYNCDEMEIPNSTMMQTEKTNSVEEILSFGDFPISTDLKSKKSKCLHIEKSQLYIEVSESDYLKTLGLHVLDFEENGKQLFSESKSSESSNTIYENAETTRCLVQNDAGKQLYELEINPLQLGQDRHDLINYTNSQNTSLLATSENSEEDNEWIVQPVDLEIEPSIRKNSHMTFIDNLQANFLNPQPDSSLKNYEDILGNNQSEIQTPMVRLVQNEDGEQFFELVRDSSDYHQVFKTFENSQNDKSLENVLEQDAKNGQTVNDESHKSINIGKKKSKSFRENLKATGQKFECTECKKSFSTISNLKQHTGTHFSDQQKFQCAECGMSFAWKSTLNKHMASYHRPDGPQKFVCEICPKVYNTLSQVNEHVKRDHLKERNHVCPECGKTFFKKFDLISHTRTHTNERPYVCATCGKGFHHQSHIIRHERIHSGVRPYSCNICHKSFTQQGSLKAHKQRHQDVKKLHILDYRIDEDDPIALSAI